MDVGPQSTVLQDLRLGDLVAYLELTGWAVREGIDAHWRIFERTTGPQGALYQLVLPRDASHPALRTYLADAINTLSAFSGLPPEVLVYRVARYNCDLLTVRSLEVGDARTLPLQLASWQLLQLARLVLYAACAEQKTLPHFTYADFAAAQQMIEHFRLGSPPVGPFGFVIEAPILHQPVIFQQRSFFSDAVEEILVTPVERRIIERIVRGLLFTRQVAEDHDLENFVRRYVTGFNANMCEALVRMSRNKTVPTEYEILWSPKVAPAEDLRDLGPIRLDHVSYTFLERAACELTRVEPRRAVIQGHVVGLSAKDDPLSKREFPRTVTIEWLNRPGGRTASVLVDLRTEDSLTAYHAHLHWEIVEVMGVLHRVGNVWCLSEPRGFRVVTQRVSAGQRSKRKRTEWVSSPEEAPSDPLAA